MAHMSWNNGTGNTEETNPFGVEHEQSKPGLSIGYAKI